MNRKSIQTAKRLYTVLLILFMYAPIFAMIALSFNASLDTSAASGSGVTNLGGVSVVINGYNVRSDEELVELIAYKLQDLLSYRRD